MGYRINYSELAERIGSGTATFADKLADGVRNFACILWNNFPDQITQNQSLGASFARGVMTAACSTSPPPPSPPFIGGQCDCITYTFSHNYNLNGDPPGTVRTFAANVWGPVEQWRAIAVAVDSVRVQVYCKGVNAPRKQEVCSLLGWYSIFTINQPDTQAVIDSITNVQVTRADGQPDNCGDPVSEYPPTAPTVNDYSTTITINQDDGTSLTFPVVYAPVDFNFPLNFDLGGIKITFDLGGIDFNFNETNNFGDTINLNDGQEAPLPPPADDRTRYFPSPIIRQPNDQDYDTETKTENDPKEEEVGVEIEFVQVTLTTVPTNAKIQDGDTAPRIVYAGWFEWQAEGFNFPRSPIHFDQNIFRKPEGATGYAYTLKKGVLGFAKIYKLKQE